MNRRITSWVHKHWVPQCWVKCKSETWNDTKLVTVEQMDERKRRRANFGERSNCCNMKSKLSLYARLSSCCNWLIHWTLLCSRLNSLSRLCLTSLHSMPFLLLLSLSPLCKQATTRVDEQWNTIFHYLSIRVKYYRSIYFIRCHLSLCTLDSRSRDHWINW